MNARYAFNWSIWIAFFTAGYVFIYASSPLYKYGIMPCTFIGLPIYFAVGAKSSEYFDHCSSAVIGVGWAAVSLSIINFLKAYGVSEDLTMTITIFVVSVALCGMHLLLHKVAIFSRIPMIFGGVASTFLVGIDKWPCVMITLCLGITLAFICQSGKLFLDENGRWKKPHLRKQLIKG